MNNHVRLVSGTAALTLLLTMAGFCATPSPATTPAAPAKGEDLELTMSPALISRADATRLAQATLKECASRGVIAAVVVADSAGHVRAAFAEDNTKLASILRSNQKVAAVRDFKISTSALEKRSKADKTFADRYGADERYHLSPGGLPIYRDGRFVAIIGVGGGREVTEECALAALKTLNWASTEPSANIR